MSEMSRHRGMPNERSLCSLETSISMCSTTLLSSMARSRAITVPSHGLRAKKAVRIILPKPPLLSTRLLGLDTHHRLESYPTVQSLTPRNWGGGASPKARISQDILLTGGHNCNCACIHIRWPLDLVLVSTYNHLLLLPAPWLLHQLSLSPR